MAMGILRHGVPDSSRGESAECIPRAHRFQRNAVGRALRQAGNRRAARSGANVHPRASPPRHGALPGRLARLGPQAVRATVFSDGAASRRLSRWQLIGCRGRRSAPHCSISQGNSFSREDSRAYRHYRLNASRVRPRLLFIIKYRADHRPYRDWSSRLIRKPV